MKEIRGDYIARELRDMALLTAMLAAAIGVAIPTAYISPLFLLLIPLFAVWFLVRVYRRAAKGLAEVSARPGEWKARVGREYHEEHLTYRVAYGEIHLLESCLVCRHKRRLLLIPIDELVSVSKDYRLVGVKSVSTLYLRCAGGRRHTLEFSAFHAENGEFVYAWLAARVGNTDIKGEC